MKSSLSFEFRLPINLIRTAIWFVGGVGILALIGKLADRGESKDGEKKKEQRKPLPQKPVTGKQGATSPFGDPRRKPTEDPDDEPGPSGPQKVNLQQLLSLAEKASRGGDFDRAEQYYLLALETLEKMDADLFSIGIITYAVGLNYRKKHELEFSEEYISRAINIFNELISDPATLNTSMASQILDQYADMLATIAEVYADLERFEEAEANLMKCFQFLEKKAEVIEQTKVNNKQEEDSRAKEKVKTEKQIGVLYDNLASLRMKQNRLEEAEVAGKKAVSILSSSFGPLEVITVQAKMKLASMYHDQRRMNDENTIYESILSEIEAESGKTSPRTASFLQFIGHQNMRKEGLTYAEGCLQRALEIYSNLADNEMDADKKTANELEVMNDLINVFMNQGNESDAFRTRQMTKELLKKSKGAAPLITTEFLKTIRASFNYEPADKLEDLKVFFNVILERTEVKLTEDAFIVCTFENPVEGEAPLVLEQKVTPDQTTVLLKSEQIPKTEIKVYEVTIELFKSAEKQEKLSTHHLFIKGTLDTSEVKDKEDLQMKLYEARTKSALFN